MFANMQAFNLLISGSMAITLLSYLFDGTGAEMVIPMSLSFGGAVLVVTIVTLRISDFAISRVYASAGVAGLTVALMASWPLLPTRAAAIPVVVATIVLGMLSVTLFARNIEAIRIALAQAADKKSDEFLRESDLKPGNPVSSAFFYAEARQLIIIPVKVVLVTGTFLWWVPNAGVTPPVVLALLILLVLSWFESTVLVSLWSDVRYRAAQRVQSRIKYGVLPHIPREKAPEIRAGYSESDASAMSASAEESLTPAPGESSVSEAAAERVREAVSG